MSQRARRPLGRAGRETPPTQREPAMKNFLIKYHFKNGSPEAWRQWIVDFISALDSDPELKGKISYQAMKRVEGADYYHLARVSDEAASSALGRKDFFKRYTEETKRVAGGEVEVVPLEIVAETAPPS
jgi:hypothetical protein